MDMKMNELARVGFVVSRQPEKHRVRVEFRDTVTAKLVSGWLPVLVPRASADMAFDLPDVGVPSAMQNDVHMEQAKQIAANGVKYYIEVANMPTTNDALKFLMEQPGMIVAPSKAVNAGGVATSALEMAQNSERLVWTAEEVDKQLHQIMNTIYQMSVDAAEEYGLGYNLVAGANIAGFKRVAEAMMEQGVF